jgi:hypothetical protein
MGVHNDIDQGESSLGLGIEPVSSSLKSTIDHNENVLAQIPTNVEHAHETELSALSPVTSAAIGKFRTITLLVAMYVSSYSCSRLKQTKRLFSP